MGYTFFEAIHRLTYGLSVEQEDEEYSERAASRPTHRLHFQLFIWLYSILASSGNGLLWSLEEFCLCCCLRVRTHLVLRSPGPQSRQDGLVWRWREWSYNDIPQSYRDSQSTCKRHGNQTACHRHASRQLMTPARITRLRRLTSRTKCTSISKLLVTLPKPARGKTSFSGESWNKNV